MAPQTTSLTAKQAKLSGAVESTAVWPSHLQPVAWHSGSDMVRAEVSLYHKTNTVHDGEVEYRRISVSGPNGKRLHGALSVDFFREIIFRRLIALSSLQFVPLQHASGRCSPRHIYKTSLVAAFNLKLSLEM